ncbi:hypothetical protein MPTK2_4g01330 [Marchantia polymorpha subsp. ruderalis]
MVRICAVRTLCVRIESPSSFSCVSTLHVLIITESPHLITVT